MTLSSVSEIYIATFRAHDYQQMYHLSKPVITMETPFSVPNINSNSIDILKKWVKVPATFKMTPLQDEYIVEGVSVLVIFACRLYGQESIETFLRSWVIALDQLANWSHMLAHMLMEQVRGS